MCGSSPSILSSSHTLRQHQGPAASFVHPPITIRGFPGGSVVKNPSAHAGDTSSICGLEDLLEEEMATHSCILAWRIPDRGAWRATGHGVSQSWTQLSSSRSLSVLTLLSHISLFGIESGLIFVTLPINFYSFYYKFIVPISGK